MASVVPPRPGSYFLALSSVVLLLLPAAVSASQGDKEPVYRDCVKQCVRTNCTGARLRGFQSAQPPYMILTGMPCHVMKLNVSGCINAPR